MDLLDNSQICAGKFKILHKPFEFIGLAEEVWSMLFYMAAENQINLLLQYDPNVIPETIVSDQKRI